MRPIHLLTLFLLATIGCAKKEVASPPAASPPPSTAAPSANSVPPAISADNPGSSPNTASISQPSRDSAQAASLTSLIELRRDDWGLVGRGQPVTEPLHRPLAFEHPRGLKLTHNNPLDTTHLIHRHLLEGDYTVDVFAQVNFFDQYSSYTDGQHEINFGVRDVEGRDEEAMLLVPVSCANEIEHHFRCVRANGKLSIEVNGQSREVTNATGVARGHFFFLFKNGAEVVVRRCELRTGGGASSPSPRDSTDLVIDVGGRITDVVVGGAGRFLVATVPSKQKLAIVDVASGKLCAELPVTGQPRVAAGRDKLVVLSGKPQRLETFDLESLMSLQKIILPADSDVKFIAMGSDSLGPLMTVYQRADASYEYRLCRIDDFHGQILEQRIVNTTSADPVPIDWSKAKSLRASTDGLTFFVEAGEYYTFRVRGNEVTVDSARNSNRHGPSNAPYRFGVALTEDGQRVHFSHRMWSGDRGGYPLLDRNFVVPAVQGDVWAQVPWWKKTEDGVLPLAGNQVILYRPSHGQEPQTIELSDVALDLTPWHFIRRDAPEFASQTGGLAADQRLIVAPALRRLATIPESNDRIVLRDFDFGELQPETLQLARAVPLRVVSPGETVEVKLEILSSRGGVRLQPNGQAQPGLSIFDDGTVRWEVPENFSYQEVTQHLLAEDAGGQKLTIALQFLVAGEPEFASTPFWKSGQDASEKFPLNTPLANVAIGGTGKYLVIHQPAEKRLRVFDTHAREWLGHVDVPDSELLLTAGADRVVAYQTKRSRLESWSLPDLKPLAARSLPRGEVLSQMAMGSRSTGPLFVVSAGRNRKAAPELYDATTLRPLAVYLPEYRARKSGVDFEKSAHLRVSGDGRFAALSAGRKIRLYRDKDGLVFSDHERLVGGPLMLGPLGHGIFGAHGMYGLVPSHSGWGVLHAIPSPESRLFVVIGTPKKGTRDELSPDAVSIAGLDARSKHLTVPVPGLRAPITAKDFSPPTDSTGPYLMPDQRVIFLPSRELLITIPKSNDSLELVTVRVKDFRTLGGNDYWYFDSPLLPAEVEPGSTLEHQFHLSARRNLLYELLEGPESCNLDSHGKLTWQVPTAVTPQPYRFKLRVHDARGQRQEEELYVFAKTNDRRDGSNLIEAEPVEQLATQTSEIPLDATVEEIVPAAHGQYLLLRLEGERRLHVLDVTAKKIIREIPLPSESALFAAGASKLVIVDPVTREMEIRSLATWKVESRPNWPLESAPMRLAMGALSEGPLGVLVASRRAPDHNADLELIDMDGFRHRPFRYIGMESRPRIDSWLRASADGSTFACSPGNMGGSAAYQMVRIQGNTAQVFDHRAPSGYLLPSANGDYACTDLEPIRVGREPSSRRAGTSRPVKRYSVPSVDGIWHLSVETQFDTPRYPVLNKIGGAPQPPIRLGIQPFGHAKPLLKFDDEDFAIARQDPRGGLYVDRQIHFIPEANRLVLIPPEGDRVFVRAFDLRKELKEAGAEFFGVTSVPPAEASQGDLFKYQIKCFSTSDDDMSFELEGAPDGTQVNAQGMLTWQVPRDASPDHDFSVRISVAVNRSVRHEFSLRINPRALPLVASAEPVEPEAVPLGDEDGSRITIALPERYESFAIGGRGRFLVPRTGTDRLMILDLQTQQIRGSLPVSKQSLFTAGASCLVVADPETKRLQTWSLPELKQLKSIPLPFETPGFVAMGSAAETPIWLGASESPWLILYDARTLEQLDLPLRSHQPTNLAIEPTHNIRVSADGLTVAMGHETGGNALELMQIRGDGVHLSLRSNARGFALPNFDGSRFLLPNGHLRFEGEVTISNQRFQNVRLPAINSDLLATIPRSRQDTRREFEFKYKRAYVPEVAIETEVGERTATVLDLPVWPPEDQHWSGQPKRVPDQEVVFVPRERLFVVANEDRESLLLYRFDVNRRRASQQPCLAEQPPRWADAGSLYVAALPAVVEEGEPTFQLDLAPDGMTLSTEGVLRWEVPADTLRGERTVSFTIGDATGRQSTHSFSLYVHSKQQPLPASERITRRDIALVSGIDGVAFGRNGRFMVVHSKAAKRLSVVDLQQSKVVKTLPVDDPVVLFAASKDKLVVVLAQQRVMARWNLNTMARDALKVLPEGTKIASIALGSDSTGPLFVGIDNGSDSRFAFFDLETLEPRELSIDPVAHVGPRPRVLFTPDQCIGVPSDVHASASGSLFTFRSRHPGGAEMNVLTLAADAVHRVRSVERRGPLVPSGDGQILYEQGKRFGVDLFPLADGVQIPGTVRPAETGTLVVAHVPTGGMRSTADYHPQVFRTERVLFYNDGDNVPLWQLEDFDFGVDPPSAHIPLASLALHQRLFYIPSQSKLVAVPNVADRLMVWDIDVEQQLRNAKQPYLWVASRPAAWVKRGQVFEYPLDVMSSASAFTFNIQSGPDGMTVNSDGHVRWPVPADFGEDVQDVVVSVRTSDDRETLQTFSLRIVPAL